MLSEIAISHEKCTAAGIAPNDRLLMLRNGVRDLRSYLDAQFSDYTDTFDHLSVRAADLNHAVTVAVNLLNLRHVPGWSAVEAHAKLPLGDMLEGMMEKIRPSAGKGTSLVNLETGSKGIQLARDAGMRWLELIENLKRKVSEQLRSLTDDDNAPMAQSSLTEISDDAPQGQQGDWLWDRLMGTSME